MNLRKKRETRSFSEAILQENELKNLDKIHYGYIYRSLYHQQLKNVLNLFNKSQLLVIDSSRFINEWNLVKRELSNFLDIKIHSSFPLENTSMQYRNLHLGSLLSKFNRFSKGRLRSLLINGKFQFLFTETQSLQKSEFFSLNHEFKKDLLLRLNQDTFKIEKDFNLDLEGYYLDNEEFLS